MARQSAAVVWALIATACGTAAGRNAIDVDFYRAMEGANVGVYTLENNDLASLVGALKYVHTEVIAEHSISPNDRLSRKYSIDVISKSRFRVKNPSRLLSPTSGMVQHVDFGGYVTYDMGEATNSIQLEHIQTYGGYVGVQDQRDVRFVYEEPYYWFSVTGFCPNLTWAHKGTLQSPSPHCLKSDGGRVVMGGLCRGTNSSVQQPTGDLDCTYTYGNASVVALDELVGIREEDCGGRRCADWADFRRNCTNATYRRSFDPRTGEPVAFPYCVEYDISPLCEADCGAAACRALAPAARELGLPFWRGRCSARHNARRAGLLAAAFGAAPPAAPAAAAAAPAAAPEPCALPGGMCHPAAASGGMYCSRAWAGVCQACWIPGTELPYPARDQPLCPYGVLGSPDYRGRAAAAPRCRSARPRDLCCLYRSPPSCAPSVATPGPELPLDEDGYALAAARQSTPAMAAFLARVAAERLGRRVADPAGLEELAAWEWGVGPRRGGALAAAEAAMAPYLAAPTPSPTTTTAARTTTAAAPAAPATTAAAEPAATSSGAATAAPVPAADLRPSTSEPPTSVPSRCASRKGLITLARAFTAILVLAIAQ